MKIDSPSPSMGEGGGEGECDLIQFTHREMSSSMNKIKIRKATPKEIPDIVFLNSFVQRIHAEQYPDMFKPLGNHGEVSQFFEFILSKEHNFVLLA
jgi:hypothetical protein